MPPTAIREPDTTMADRERPAYGGQGPVATCVRNVGGGFSPRGKRTDGTHRDP
jgi:hypothetical protein